MTQRLHVYVAAPLSKGDQLHNVHDAIKVGDLVMEAGHVPFVPHLSALWHMQRPRVYEDWMTWCLAWVARCDVVVRLEGESPGADREVARAKELGLPVVHLHLLDVGRLAQALEALRGGLQDERLSLLEQIDAQGRAYAAQLVRQRELERERDLARAERDDMIRAWPQDANGHPVDAALLEGATPGDCPVCGP